MGFQRLENIYFLLEITFSLCYNSIVPRGEQYNLEIALMYGEFMTASQAAKKWDITQRRVQILCAKGRIDGVFKLGENWVIPTNAQKPIDGRVRKEKENV